MLADLMALQDPPNPQTVVVSESIGDAGLVFRPQLRHSGFHPEILTKLSEHGLVDLTRHGDSDYRVYVTPVGRDYYDDMCGLT